PVMTALTFSSCMFPPLTPVSAGPRKDADSTRLDVEQAVELPWLAAERIDEGKRTCQQFERMGVIVIDRLGQLRVERIVEDGRAEAGHMHAQLVFATGDRLQCIAPTGAATIDDLD